MRHTVLETMQKMLTSIEAIITGKHDATAHNVPFEAAWSKRVPDSAALEQLSIIYKEKLISASCHIHERV